ncbi:MAG: TonB-dependent receptor [Candidatus Eremiobacteraeota bacterium]|nr:TonB-dependent receptor [Candidatus Eremiobacteraeota bacterium]
MPSCFSPSGADYTNGGATPAYILGPFNAFSQAYEQVRDTVGNFHFGIPRKDGNKDDVQVLFDNEHISNYGYDSPNDLGGQAYLSAIGYGPVSYVDTHETTLPYGTLLAPGYTGNAGVVPYLFPFSSSGRVPGSNVGDNTRDEYVNDQSILKVQYQHNFGTNAFLRVYGYTYYSDWLNNGPNSTFSNYLAFDSPDYELNSHTRGVSLQFSDQLNAQHLLSFTGSYTSAHSLRYNNSFYGISGNTVVGYLVNGSDPSSGTCYQPDGTAVPGCAFSGASARTFGFTVNQAVNGTIPVPTATSCGGGPCQYMIVAGGPTASYNTVIPKFSTFSLTDTWTPTSRLNVNLGLRFDRFEFDGSNTQNSIARTLFFNAYNLENPTTPLQNASNQVEAYNVVQPRAGFTYTLNPSTVIRANYGRYAQAPNTAFEQYDYLQPNSTGSLGEFNSLGLGNTPGHNVRPEISNNYDFSLEHQFGSDLAVKLSPFLRSTQDQIQQFYLDQKTNFVSGLNVGRQTSKGIELEVDKGDFSRNGLAGRFSFTYTNSTIKYNLAPNGSSVVTGINQLISGYNALTKAGGGAACYAPTQVDSHGNVLRAGGADATCSAAGTVANPYYNASPQGLLDPNASYPTFDIFPAGIGTSYNTFGAPYVGTILVQYKHGPLAITPAIQVAGGQRYGAPANTPGIDPSSCSEVVDPTTGAVITPAVLPGSTSGDPRYNNGAAGGSPYNASQCGAGTILPNPVTGLFDGLGQYVAPTHFQLHLQTTYDLNKRVTLVANFANIVDRCFGGSKTPFTVNHACGYSTLPGGAFTPVGNAYNPGNAIQPILQNAYYPTFATNPFNLYLEARIKI